MTRLGIDLSDKAYELLKQEADERGATISYVVREILEGHFQKKGLVGATQWSGTDAPSNTTATSDDEPSIIHTLPPGIDQVDGKYYATDTNTGKRVEIDPEQMWFWTEEWQAGEHEVDAQLARGEYTDFDSVDDLFAAL